MTETFNYLRLTSAKITFAATLLFLAGLIFMNTSSASTLGPYPLANARSGKCLDMADHASGKGTFAVLGPCDKADQWFLVSQPNGTYLVVNARSNLCLNVYGGGTADTTFVIQWSCSTTAKNNLWKVGVTLIPLPIGGGFPAFRFVDSHSGKPLVPVYGLTDTGTFVVIDGSTQPKYNDLWLP